VFWKKSADARWLPEFRRNKTFIGQSQKTRALLLTCRIKLAQDSFPRPSREFQEAAMSATIKGTPEGTRTVTPSLIFNEASRAIEFYKKVFGAIELARMPGPNNKVMHAAIRIGDSTIFVADTMTNKVAATSTETAFVPAYLHVYVDDVDATFKAAVDAGAKVDMPLDDMFWGDRYGKITDPFGHQWSLATHKEDVAPDEMERRAQAMFSKSAGQS
jgi:PhnB protein